MTIENGQSHAHEVVVDSLAISRVFAFGTFVTRDFV